MVKILKTLPEFVRVSYESGGSGGVGGKNTGIQCSRVHDPLDKQVSDSDVTLTSFVAAAKTWEADSVELWA